MAAAGLPAAAVRAQAAMAWEAEEVREAAPKGAARLVEGVKEVAVKVAAVTEGGAPAVAV